jgi:hypothetical protein
MKLKIRGKKIFGLEFSHLIILSFWYVTLFPGKVHVDTGSQLLLIQNGQTTNQWTSSYFFILQLLTFRGESTALVSLCSLLILYFTVRYFCRVFGQSFQYMNRALTFIMCTPLFGFWGMAVNHDIFAACGSILLFSLSAEYFIYHKRPSIFILIAGVLLSTFSYLTLSSACVLALFFLIKRRIKDCLVVVLTVSTFLVINFSGIYVTPKSETSISLLSDIKCATESFSNNLDQKDWNTLTTLAPKAFWVTPQKNFTCYQSNNIFGEINKLNLDSKEVLQVWIHVLQDQPTVVFLSHLMKSSQAFPPLVMQPPTNYLDISGNSRDFRNPQSNSWLMTTRDGSKNFPVPGISIIGNTVDFTGFIVNLRTDYLGWAGLWLILSMLILIFKFRNLKYLWIFFTVGAPHVMVFLLAPGVDLRYLAGTCLIGYLFSVEFLIRKYFVLKTQHGLKSA